MKILLNFFKRSKPEVKPDVSELSREELEIMALNKLIEIGGITSREGQLYLMTGEIPDTADITKRIIEKYGK